MRIHQLVRVLESAMQELGNKQVAVLVVPADNEGELSYEVKEDKEGNKYIVVS